MKANILDIQGKKKTTIELPKVFSSEIREDIVAKALEVKKAKQPYSPSPVAGKQQSASGKLVHRRHVWKSQYGRGISRIPRKITSRRGTQFIWVGATVPQARGGRKAHPPKAISMINTKKINKKESAIALKSAISATASEKIVKSKYKTLKDKKIENLPLIIESKITSLKIKDLLQTLKKILDKELYNVAIKKKSVRSGRGKLRGRKYKKTAGLLLVVGKDEKLKTSAIEVVPVNKLGVQDLAKGGLGRLTIYTENAIKYLGDNRKDKKWL